MAGIASWWLGCFPFRTIPEPVSGSITELTFMFPATVSLMCPILVKFPTVFSPLCFESLHSSHSPLTTSMSTTTISCCLGTRVTTSFVNWVPHGQIPHMIVNIGPIPLRMGSHQLPKNYIILGYIIPYI